MEDFNHPKKRNHIFENISNDLISNGFSGVSSTMVRNKWNSLNKSYRKAKDMKSKSGRAPSRFMFFEQLDEILGNSPSNSCNHSINSENITSEDPSCSVTPEPPNNETNTTTTGSAKKRNLRREYLDFQKEQSEKKQKRHEEKMKIEREKIEIEKRKLELLERFLAK